MAPDPISEFVFNDHALFEMARRGLSEAIVGAVLNEPEQRFEVRPGRHVLQSRLQLGHPPRQFLV